MDIIDVMLAKALTPQGQIESFARQSQIAVTQANQAVATINTITQQTNTNNTKSAETLAAAEEALENASAAESRIETALESIQGSSTEQIDNEIDKIALSLAATATGSRLTLTTPSGAQKSVEGWPTQKLYTTTGVNTDGALTQKAITDALAALNNRIDSIPSSSGSSGGVSNLGANAAGHIVVVDEDGNIIASDITEEALVQALIKSGAYNANSTLGLLIDYENKSYERSQDAIGLQPGINFDSYAMYGGRMRCNVNDDGTITAFYGDSNYREDGSNGQVMIYQPKFYYQRAFLKEQTSNNGIIIRKENLIISPKAQVGFKLHPLFKVNGEELDYVLLPAYEGSVYDVSSNSYLLNNEDTVDENEDKLSSIAGAKPFNGAKINLTVDKMKKLAENRGEGWQLTTLESESALQMLEIIEFGSMNGQNSLEKGIVEINRSNSTDCSTVTGSTASLGNSSGAATSTILDRDGSRTTLTVAGQRAISYRGMENPWGEMWRIIGNATVRGGGNNLGGIPYYNETPLNIQMPISFSSWVSAMGYQNANYDWIYMPLECSSNANSAVPIGDALWTTSSLNGTNLLAIGGSINSNEAAGPFYYSADISLASNIRYFNGRIMYVPTKNSIYNANITKWHAHYEED